MNRIIPELTEPELDRLKSAAEARLYRSLRDHLSDDYLVLFQVGWVLRKEDEQARDGETDFLIAHPDYGFLCIEVKGGGIGFEAGTGDWYSIDRHHQKHHIKNPVQQALRAKFSVLTKMKESLQWERYRIGRVACGHATFFPDIHDARPMVRPDLPETLIGVDCDLESIDEWVRVAMKYWSESNRVVAPLGRHGMQLIKDTFAHSFEVSPLVFSLLQDLEAHRLRLTQDQLRVLDMLRSQRRVSVSGGAGTGKTVLAVEKAKRLAAEGFATLLTCYNRKLADHLSGVCAGIENLDVMSFHQLCYQRIRMSKEQSGRDLLEEAKVTYPGFDLYDVQYPVALSYSLDVVQKQYDAIVCDEGQDFREEYWFPVEMLLSEYDTSPLYIFFDDNQNIYSRAGTFPIKSEPYLLVSNCRNTDQIHSIAYRYYKGEPVMPPGIEGDAIELIDGASVRSQAERLNTRIVELIAREKVPASDIVVLLADGRRKHEYYDAMTGLTLPKPTQWVIEGDHRDGVVLIDTVSRFKGLESAIVFLWGVDTLDLERESELLYVGLSRAKSIVYVVSTLEIYRRICGEVVSEKDM